MISLQSCVRKALAGLLLPPLQDLVLEYLPDRGILRIHYRGEKWPETFEVDDEWVEGWARLWDGDRFLCFIPFQRKFRRFSKFSFSTQNFKTNKESFHITLVYQGEPEIVQIE
jgi:hypothetical protein